MRKVELGEESKVCIKWKVLPMDYSEEEEKNIISKFAQKYGISKNNIKVEPVFISHTKDGEESEYANEISVNIQDPAYQPKLFKQWLEEKEITDYDFDKIIEIDNLINSKINYEAYEKCKRYTLKWIKWSNFMSYGPDNFFDFTNLKGLVLLSSEPANQGGKTTFCLDLFRFLLFGKVTSRDSEWVLAKAFNRHLPEATEVTVEGCISIDGNDYVIKRTISRPVLSRRTAKSKVSQKIDYYHIVNGQYIELSDEEQENEAGSTATETNKLIKEAIGNERDFDLMICVTQRNLESLISLKDTERGRLITRWVGLLPIEEKDVLAREHYNKTVVPSLYLNKYNKEDLKSEVEDLNTEINDNELLIKRCNADKEETEKKLDESRKTRDILLESKQAIDENLIKADVVTVKATIQRIGEEGKRKKEEKANNEAKLEKIKDIEFNEADYKAKVAADKQKSIELTSARSACANIKKDIDALVKGEFCPTCGARLRNVDNAEKIKEKQAEYDRAVEKGKLLKTEVENLEKEISELDVTREKYNEKIRLQLIIDKNEVDIENLRAKYRENDRLLKDIQANEDAIRKNNQIDVNINIQNANIKVEEEHLNILKGQINESDVQIKNCKKTIAEYTKVIKVIEDEEVLVKNWKLYLNLIGKNGISKMVLRNALPLINGELKRMLNGVCDFDVEIVIDDRNDVAFHIIKDGVVDSLASGSGFEQTVASLALRSVLGKISSFSKPSFIVLDEVLGGVADENYDALKLLYDKIVADYSFIFQITHLKQIADWHSANIVVKKTDNISRIEKIM